MAKLKGLLININFVISLKLQKFANGFVDVTANFGFKTKCQRIYVQSLDEKLFKLCEISHTFLELFSQIHYYYISWFRPSPGTV